MTPAQSAAWTIYKQRVEAMLQTQVHAFARGEVLASIAMTPPTSQNVETISAVINAAVKAARLEVVSMALAPVYQGIDAIDNSHTKSETVKAIRGHLQKAYDDLHALKLSIEQPTEQSK